MPSTIETVLFDVDGTLLDSNGAHAQAWADALAERGYHVPAERIRPLIGMGGDKLLPALNLGLDKATEPGKSIAERRGEIFLERYAPALRPTPGARELVLLLRDRGLRCVVASSAQKNELDALLKAAGVDGLFEDAATSGDAKESKPDPDIVNAALKRSKTGAGCAVLIGDTSYDIEAAKRAGVPAIALRCGGWDDDHLNGAAAIYDDPAELARALRTSSIDDLVAAARH